MKHHLALIPILTKFYFDQRNKLDDQHPGQIIFMESRYIFQSKVYLLSMHTNYLYRMWDMPIMLVSNIGYMKSVTSTTTILGFYSLNCKIHFTNMPWGSSISCNIKLDSFISLNLTGTLASELPRHQQNFRVIKVFKSQSDVFKASQYLVLGNLTV